MRLGEFALCALLACHTASAVISYSYVGSGIDKATATQGGEVLMGGGSDVDAAFVWMCARANGGDFLVIRADNSNGYNK